MITQYSKYQGTQSMNNLYKGHFRWGPTTQAHMNQFEAI